VPETSVHDVRATIEAAEARRTRLVSIALSLLVLSYGLTVALYSVASWWPDGLLLALLCVPHVLVLPIGATSPTLAIRLQIAVCHLSIFGFGHFAELAVLGSLPVAVATAGMGIILLSRRTWIANTVLVLTDLVIVAALHDAGGQGWGFDLAEWYRAGAATSIAIVVLFTFAELGIRIVTREFERLGERLLHENQMLVDARQVRQSHVVERDQWVELVHHELRTPLGAVMGVASLLDPSALPKEDSALVQTLRDSVDSFRRCLPELEPNQIAETLPTDTLRDAVHDVVDLLRPRAIERGASLDIKVDAAVPKYSRLDQRALRKVLLNLVSNALSYGGSEIEVHIHAMSLSSGLHRLRFEVLDRGNGVPLSEVPRLMGRFVSGSGGGSGLGLAICHRIAEARGWSLRYAARVGGGSRFVLEVDTDGVAGPRRVLVVDDNPVNRKILAAMSRALGYDADTAESGEAAIASVMRRDFDVVLLDYQLTDTDGAQVARAIRSAPLFVQPKLVAVTAHASNRVRQECMLAGMDEFLTKPIERFSLAEALEVSDG